MNNKILFKICLVAALSLAASSAFANTSITGTTVLGGGTFSPSKNVTINVVSTSTDYAAKSGHLNGDRTIMTNNSSPIIYWTSKATGTEPGTVSGATEAVNTSWTSL